MSSSRAGSCICLCRSWRTACCCLQPPRLVLALSIIYIILHSSQSQARYSQDPDITYYTTSCGNNSWCGERWAPNRILRYTYHVNHTLVVDHSQHQEHDNDCSGAQDSLNCVYSGGVLKNRTNPRRVTTIVRSSTPEITVMPAMNLYLITTDNINESSNTSDSYPLNQDKIWQIHIPKGCKMSVHFFKFDLQVTEAADRCKQDYFTVQTSKTQQDIRKYCNNLHWIELKRIRRVQMTFHSDNAVARDGIKAVACLSNLNDPSNERELNEQLPCTCDRSVQRKKKDSQSYKFLKAKIAAEKRRVSQWLHLFMQGGQEVIDDVLRDPDDPKQRHLAEQYQEVLNRHREW